MIKVLDLFCGLGGLAQGFRKAGFDVTGVDFSKQVGRVFRENRLGNFIKADLSSEFIGDGYNKYDIIIGGPPCKPWSTVNTIKRGYKHSDYELLSRFFDHVEYHLPEIFVLENVPPLANDEVFIYNINRLRNLSYSIEYSVIKYSDYGAPTSRHRLFVFGRRRGSASIFFHRLSEYRCPPKTVRDVIWHLRDKEEGEVRDHVWPKFKTIHRYLRYYKTGKFGWYVLKWDKSAPSFGNITKTYILHPDAFNGKHPRVISVREALLLMGFDEDFYFPEDIGLVAKYQMIADAVSPVFSYALAKNIRKIID